MKSCSDEMHAGARDFWERCVRDALAETWQRMVFFAPGENAESWAVKRADALADAWRKRFYVQKVSTK